MRQIVQLLTRMRAKTHRYEQKIFVWIFLLITFSTVFLYQELRLRRQEVSIELRKKNKEDQLLKRRNIEVHEPTSPLQEINPQSPVMPSMSMDEIISSISSNDLGRQFAAVQYVRKMLSRERNPPIDVVINMNLVPKLINYLDNFEKLVSLSLTALNEILE